MRKIQIAISSDLWVRLKLNLTGTCGTQQRLREWSRMVVKQFQDGGRPPFWESIIAISQWKIIRFSRNFVHSSRFWTGCAANVTWSKMKKLHWTDSEFDRTYFLIWQCNYWPNGNNCTITTEVTTSAWCKRDGQADGYSRFVHVKRAKNDARRLQISLYLLNGGIQ